MQRAGTVDTVVLAHLLTATMASGHQLFEVNLAGAARVLAAAEPLLHPGSCGICVTSMSGHGVPGHEAIFPLLDDPLDPDLIPSIEALGYDVDIARFAYPITNRGIMQMVRRLAPAWGTRGARILSVSVGPIDTPMNIRETMGRSEALDRMVAASPVGRRGLPEEAASVVAFLSSDGAAFMTGSDVLVDGGMIRFISDSTGGQGRRA
jgi:NAD(P)-dependent dehydrogenase (short-subunit alcohol dehydrogenase family)